MLNSFYSLKIHQSAKENLERMRIVR
jgi:hypothetical protein